MFRRITFLCTLVCLVGCASVGPTGARLNLPDDPLQITIVQRHSKAVPGSNGSLNIHIGDITAGQVLFALHAKDGDPIIDTVSVKRGDVISFQLENQRYYISLDTLQNFLVGDDFAVFTISSRAPCSKAQEEESGKTSQEASGGFKTPKKWAQPIKLAGVPNLHRVTQDLYRSAQPTAEGMRNIKKIGIKTIVNLRSFHSDRDEIGETGLAYEHIYMKAWHAEEEDVVRFLQIVTDHKRTPVLIHCEHGADRTGTMCAIYRIAVCGWAKEEAIKEMTQGGFGFHMVWKNLIHYIENLDVDSIKKRAGIGQEKHNKSMNIDKQ